MIKIEKLALTIIYLKRIFIVGLVYLMQIHNIFISAKLTKPLFDTLDKIKHYLANFIEKEFTVKRVSLNIVDLFVTILRVK